MTTHKTNIGNPFRDVVWILVVPLLVGNALCWWLP
jgi:hypothetical protein